MGSCVSAVNYCNSGSRRRHSTTLEHCAALSNRSLNQIGNPDPNNNSPNALNNNNNTATQQSTNNGNNNGNNNNNNNSNRSTRGNIFRSPSFSNTTSNNSTSSYAATAAVANAQYFNPNVANFTTSYSYYVPPTGKNKRLKKDFHKYLKYEKRLSEAQLKAKRDEFWDTAPAFEGKPEIWSALQAAVDSIEAKNFELAQAIIDSANIIVPNGLLNDCYDELGNRYQIPVYVLVKPTNLSKKATASTAKGKKPSSSRNTSAASAKLKSKKKSGKNRVNDENDEGSEGDEPFDDDDDDFYDENDDFENEFEDEEDEEAAEARRSRKKRNAKNNTKPSTSNKSTGTANVNSPSTAAPVVAPPVEEEETIPIKFRVSSLVQDTNSDLRLSVRSTQTVASLKQQLKEMTQIDTASQRMYFGGKLMRDKERLRVHKLKKNVVIQVIVRPAAKSAEESGAAGEVQLPLSGVGAKANT